MNRIFFFFSVKKRIRTDSVLKYEFFMSLFKSLFWKETNCRVPSIMAHQKYSMTNWSLTQKTKKFIPINRLALLHAERGLQHKNCNEACKNMDDELMKPAGPEPVSRQGEWTSELLRSTQASSRSARQKPLSVFKNTSYRILTIIGPYNQQQFLHSQQLNFECKQQRQVHQATSPTAGPHVWWVLDALYWLCRFLQGASFLVQNLWLETRRH